MRRGPARPRFGASRQMLLAASVGAGLAAAGFALARLDDALQGRRDALLVVGSETLRPLIAACGDELVARRPGLQLVVRGGGSGAGLSALRGGQADLAMVSRPLTDAERRERDEPGPGPRVIPVAFEAIAIIAHPSVDLDALDLDQLARLLDGRVRDWAGLGTAPLPVVVIGRDEGSGTAAVVEDHVLQGRPLAPQARRLPTHEAVIEAVMQTPGALAYVAAGRAPRPGEARWKLLALRARPDGPALRPDVATVARGDYPLARSLALVSIGVPRGAAASLMAACRGEAVAARREALGLLPAPGEVLVAGDDARLASPMAPRGLSAPSSPVPASR